MLAYSALAIRAYIEALFKVMELIKRKMQVADAAARAISLTGNLPVMFKQLM